MGMIKEDYIDSLKLKNGRIIRYYSLRKLGKKYKAISTWPFSMRVLMESVLRNLNGKEVKEEDVRRLMNWRPGREPKGDVPFVVSRVLMQDFTGVPAVVDIAAMREYVTMHNLNPNLITPRMPVNLIIDHSVQVDAYAIKNALQINQRKEIERNGERYKLLKWAGEQFSNFSVVPPSGGICHQVNLEHIATCVSTRKEGKDLIAFPDTLVGTDSHTTMVNGLGVLGFGVGGIEAEAALLGQPVALSIPKVIGVKLTGKLKEGVTATDLVLKITKILRKINVVGSFVEFFGDGVHSLTLPDRATVSNMCPEYGATVSIFPVDEETLRYMRSTGRKPADVELVKEYYKSQGMFDMDYGRIKYSKTVYVKLEDIRPCVSGPSQPKQEMPLENLGKEFARQFILHRSKETRENATTSPSQADYGRWIWENGKLAPNEKQPNKKTRPGSATKGKHYTLHDGDVVISAITSCTNTSNPFAMIGASILARNAVKKGLSVPKHVKTSFAPGSRVVTDYLKKARLMQYLEKLGYGLVGYGCTTCIGNSGPLPEWVSNQIKSKGLSVASVLSGNRNYEARIHNDIAANYLMSPMLVIAFGLAGTVLKDLTKEPIGTNAKGESVYLKEILPKNREIYSAIAKAVNTGMFDKEYKRIFGVNGYWNKLKSPNTKNYAWNGKSTYIQLPPFFDDFDGNTKPSINEIKNARVLAVFGDSLSTDHISPAGSIPVSSPAGKYLVSHGVNSNNFNTYGSRRGNHEVMMRGTFANVKIRNLLVSMNGGYTMHMPDKKVMSIFDAAMKYKKNNVPLVVFGGREYGSGSSRDWAAKGPMLLGVKAVIAKSFERIHRSNLVGMGIIPLEFRKGEGFSELRIDASRPVSISINNKTGKKQNVMLTYYKKGSSKKATARLRSRLDTELEIDYVRQGGVLRYVLRGIVSTK